METLNQSAPTSSPAVDNDPAPTPINPVPMTSKPLGVPGFSLDAGLADRVNQATKIRRHFSIKPAIIIVLVLLFLGGGAYAWFFTDLKYKLPWFKQSEDKLVGMMYENLAKLDGADFSLTYKLSVGDRDADVKVDEKKVSDYEANMRVSQLKSNFSYTYKYGVDYCYQDNLKLQAFTGQKCDGSAEAKPKAGESLCVREAVNNNTNNGIDDFNADSFDYSNKKWADLKDFEWEYDGACSSDETSKTYSFSMHSTYNDDKITCTEKGCVWNNENLMDVSGDSSMNFDLLFGSYLEGIDNYISNNFNLEAKLSGSGFSLKEREDKQQLPNVGVGFDSKVDLGSMSNSIKMEAKLIEDFVYFKIDAFPVIDITQGHEGEWIKVDTEDNLWIGDAILWFSENQNQTIIDFRNFVAKTKDYNVLNFKATGNYLEKDGIKSPIFEVNIVPESVPNWLQDLRNLYEKDKASNGSKKAENKTYTEAEKNKIVAKVKEVMDDIKIKVALNPYTGDLMNLTVDFRIIPPASSKKFATKQFNSSLSVDLWNHNQPTSPKVPDKFIEQSEIERERLGYSKEAYQDIKQSRRIEKLRADLFNYYNDHQAWPQKLSEASKSIVDFNTGKEYPYQVNGSNYSITYQMNDVEQKANPKNEGVYYATHLNGFTYSNEFTAAMEYWDKGENKADRYSPVAHKYSSSRNLLVGNTEHYDNDVFQALEQARIIKKLADNLEAFYKVNHYYPDSLDQLSDLNSYKSSYYNGSNKNFYYVCEDLSLAKPCEYQKQGDAYVVKVNYLLAMDEISKNIININDYKIVSWKIGLNQYDPSNIQDAESSGGDPYSDTDRDGLLDFDEVKYGTNIYNKDTDNDGFYDGEEVKSGYNPNGSGKLNNIEYVKVSASDWVKGDSKAAITLIIYSDADCPYCAQFHKTANQALKDYAGKLKLVYRHFPLTQLHPEAAKKAEAIECVGELGGNSKVWEFLDKLFVDTKPTVSQLGDTVATIGINKTKFQTCLDSGKYSSKINTQSADAQTAGAQGTPYSLLIKGSNVQQINGAYPYTDIKKLIDNLLK